MKPTHGGQRPGAGRPTTARVLFRIRPLRSTIARMSVKAKRVNQTPQMYAATLLDKIVCAWFLVFALSTACLITKLFL